MKKYKKISQLIIKLFQVDNSRYWYNYLTINYEISERWNKCKFHKSKNVNRILCSILLYYKQN